MSILLFLQEEILLEYVSTGVIMVSKEYFLKEKNEHESTLQYKLWRNSWVWITVAPASTSVIKGLSVFLE